MKIQVIEYKNLRVNETIKYENKTKISHNSTSAESSTFGIKRRPQSLCVLY